MEKHYNIGKNNPNYKGQNKKKYFCIDCGKKVRTKHIKRCQKCYYIYINKNQLRKGINAHYYKDGKTLEKHYCIDCGKEIDWRAKRCVICSKIGKNNPFAGKYHTEETKYNIGKFRIGLKLSSEICKKMSLSKGGTGIPYELSEYPIEFNQELKDSIRKRDNYTCQNCDMTEEEHLIVYGMTLDVHHIDYNKKNCNKNNLITLCRPCNVRANFNRDYWKNFFENKIIIIQREIKKC